MPAEHEATQYEPVGGPGGDDVAQVVQGQCRVINSDPPGVTACNCIKDGNNRSFSAQCPSGGWGAAVEGSFSGNTFSAKVTDPNTGAIFKVQLACS